ncbi:MAG: hypothetical protein RSE47_03660 [Acidaminococcaceae bacterium]
MKKSWFLGLVVLLTCLCGLQPPTEAAFAYKPVAFVLLDNTGEVNKAIASSWYEQVRQAYHVPYYEIIKTDTPRQVALEVLAASKEPVARLTPAVFKEIAQKVPAEVVVLVALRQMQQRLVYSTGFRWHDEGGEMLEEVRVVADLYVYRTDTQQLLGQKIRYWETEEVPVSTPAPEVVKWELRRLVNKMEHREQI